jgi:hypothetical protein
MSRYPMPALWVDSSHIDTVRHVRVASVIIERVFKRETLDASGNPQVEHYAEFLTQNHFQQRLTRPLSQLASTPALALEKLPDLLTALVSRAPLSNSGEGSHAAHAMTETGAATSPQPEPAHT